MTKQDDGRWRLTMPVEAGSYYYKFVVEGVDHKDETNPTTVFGPNWSTFQVPGDETLRGEYTGTSPPSRGAGDDMTYTSTATATAASAYVWTPPDTTPTGKSPTPCSSSSTVGHRPGRTGSRSASRQILDNNYANCGLVPMVVVMSNGNGVNFPNEIPATHHRGRRGAVQRKLRRQERAIAGLSLGSGHALSTLFTVPGQFGYMAACRPSQRPRQRGCGRGQRGTKLLRSTRRHSGLHLWATMTLVNN